MSELALAKAPELPPDSDAVSGGGRLAAAAHLELVRPEADAPALTDDETSVLSLISEGNTAAQTARRLEKDREEVLELEKSVNAQLGVPNTAAAVDRAIRSGIITVETTPDSAVLERLSPLDVRMLSFYAKGGTDHQITERPGVNWEAVKGYHEGLLENIGAWNSAHAVRRAYELGIFKVGEVPDSTDALSAAASVPDSAEPAEARQTPPAS